MTGFNNSRLFSILSDKMRLVYIFCKSLNIRQKMTGVVNKGFSYDYSIMLNLSRRGVNGGRC